MERAPQYSVGAHVRDVGGASSRPPPLSRTPASTPAAGFPHQLPQSRVPGRRFCLRRMAGCCCCGPPRRRPWLPPAPGGNPASYLSPSLPSPPPQEHHRVGRGGRASGAKTQPQPLLPGHAEIRSKKKPNARTANERKARPVEEAQGPPVEEFELVKLQPKRVVKWRCGACCKLDKGPESPTPDEVFDDFPDHLQLYAAASSSSSGASAGAASGGGGAAVQHLDIERLPQTHVEVRPLLRAANQLDIFVWLQSWFGFQIGNVANQREHLILLLANIHARLNPDSSSATTLHDRAVDELLVKTFDNYLTWCKYLGRSSNIWLVEEVQNYKLLYVALYLLI